MDEKHGHDRLTAGEGDRVHPRNQSMKPGPRKKTVFRLGILVVLLCIFLLSGTRSVHQAYPEKALRSPAVHGSELHSSMGTAQRRDDVAVETASASEEAVTTDSEGTWVLASAAASSDVQETFSDTPRSTVTETASLTDRIIFSFSTETKLSTVTVPQSSTHLTTIASSTRSSTAPSSPLPTITSAPTFILASLCPYATCASTCPWTTCTSLPPTTMDTSLCQMLDPCFFAQKGYLPKPPSQGGMCACLCESGYCTDPKDEKGKIVKLSCAEWDCCHQCECYTGNPMADQSGRGDC